MDLLIAGHARALGAVLVTNNTTHFSRVKGLACENWSA
jgi:tRNA(fMet)-specific endonuclease VapC